MINLAPPPQISDARYWWALWIQPIIWLSVTQLVRIDSVKRSIIARIAISWLLIVSFERFVIIMTSFHRDYVPSGWVTSTSSDIILEIILAMILKGMLFCALVYGYLFLENKLKRLTPENE
jgi:molybdopterin-containing oxidoreductase family membrane subunit